MSKRSLQKALQDQIFDYVSMFNLCHNKTKDIRFFCILEGEIIEMPENSKNCFKLGETVRKSTRKSHHFIPLSCSKTGHKLTIEDTNFVKIFEFKIKYVEKFNHESLKYFSCHMYF